MPSGNAASGDPKLHPELRSDHLEFSCALKPWLDARGGAGVEVLNLLTRYGSMVYEQSARLSLIAGADRAHLFTRHVLDSLNPVSLFPSPPPSGVDIGSGAGFPGIPLAIVWPSSRMTLIESREKKAGFLEKVSRELGLRNVIVRCQRLEALAHEEAGREALGEAFEAAFIRAVANPTGIVESVLQSPPDSSVESYSRASFHARQPIGARVLACDRNERTSATSWGMLKPRA
jgi:16S rRNA (guanine(527)-N(7))-methyltransferase RsmG